MNSFFLDASALAKRYSLEVGADRVDYLFDHMPPSSLMCLMLGVAEVVSVLVRRRNSDLLSPTAFAQGMINLKAEIVDADDFNVLPIDNSLIAAAMPLIEKHAVNATDAVILRLALDLATQLRINNNDLVLITCDQRLLRAAQTEGLVTFDPETQMMADLEALCA